jgi:arsenate reductase
MNEVIFVCYPRCTTCKKAEKWLADNRIAAQVRDIKENNPTEQEIRSYRAEYENACDDLYYGYGYDFWRKSNKDYMPENIARIVWSRAFNKMANS